MTFVPSGTEALAAPFTNLIQKEQQDFTRPVVVHSRDNVLVDDGHIHIYYSPPSSGLGDMYVLNYEGADSARPQSLYIREGDDYEQLEALMTYLAKQFYKPKNAEDDDLYMSTTDDSFNIFTEEIGEKTSDSLENFVREILRSIRRGEEKSQTEARHPELNDDVIRHVLAYAGDFHVAFTDEDTEPNPLANYEVLEFLGDLAMWKPMTEIFLEYAESNGIEMTEQVMTAMHRSFASKDKQSAVARLLRLDVYLRKKGEITVDTYEDLFESFVGALYLVSFKLRLYLGIDLQLHERFLRWVYKGWDLSTYEIKPEITRFYEFARSLAGRSVFREHEIAGKWIMRYERGTKELITNRLIGCLNEDATNEVQRVVRELFRLIDRPYSKNLGHSGRTEKYKVVNRLIEEEITIPVLNIMTNERNTADWEDAVKAEVKTHVDFLTHVISQRFIDRARTSSYWVVEDSQREEIYSTAEYDDAENPMTLLSLIRAREERIDLSPSKSVERIPYDPIAHSSYLLDNMGKKWALRGNPAAIENEVNVAYTQGTGKFFIVIVRGNEMEDSVALEYTMRSIPYFQEQELNVLRDMILAHTQTMPSTSPKVVRYVGDRAAYGYTALIAILQHHITNVNHLTEVRNFYRSKALKKHLTEALRIRGPDGELLEFDYVVGSHIEIAEQIVMFLYHRVPIAPRTLFRSESRIKSLRLALWARAEAKAMTAARKELTKLSTGGNLDPEEGRPTQAEKARREREFLNRASIKMVKEGTERYYVYEASNGIVLRAPLVGVSTDGIRTMFADHILQYEKFINPDHSLVRSHRFHSLPGFDALKQAMAFMNVSEWQLYRAGHGGIELRYLTNGDEKVVYVAGADVEGIVRRL